MERNQNLERYIEAFNKLTYAQLIVNTALRVQDLIKVVGRVEALKLIETCFNFGIYGQDASLRQLELFDLALKPYKEKDVKCLDEILLEDDILELLATCDRDVINMLIEIILGVAFVDGNKINHEVETNLYQYFNEVLNEEDVNILNKRLEIEAQSLIPIKTSTFIYDFSESDCKH